jgi:8-oxo-dGTP diphosphatase
MTEAYRYCPQCTQPLEERLSYGRLRPVCPACGFVHFLDPKVGAGVLIERGQEILLLLRPPGDAFCPDTWGIPAGFVDHDESPRQAAAREAEEETGLRVEIGRLFDVYYYTDDPRGNGVLIIYRATAAGGALRPRPGEAAALRWFRFDALPENLSAGGLGPAVRGWAAMQRALAAGVEEP